MCLWLRTGHHNAAHTQSFSDCEKAAYTDQWASLRFLTWINKGYKQTNKQACRVKHKNIDVSSLRQQCSLLSRTFQSLGMPPIHTSLTHKAHTVVTHKMESFLQYPIFNILRVFLLTTVMPSLPIFSSAYCSTPPSIPSSILQTPGPRPGEKPITDLDILCTHTPTHAHTHIHPQGFSTLFRIAITDWC